MQVKTERSLLDIGNSRRPAIHLAIASKSLTGYLVAGMAIGVVFGFLLGSVVTLLTGEKSLLLAQQLWGRLKNANETGDHVHFELLLQ